MQYVFLPRCLLHQNHHHQTAVSAPYSMPQTMLYCPKYKKNIKISLWLIILLQYFGNIRLVWKEVVGKKAPLSKHWKTRRHWQLKASQESIQWNLFYWTANTLSTLIQELLGGSITIQSGTQEWHQRAFYRTAPPNIAALFSIAGFISAQLTYSTHAGSLYSSLPVITILPECWNSAYAQNTCAACTN